MWHFYPGQYMPSYQVNRALSQAHYGGGEFAEIIEVAQKIDPENRESFNVAWLEKGNQVFDVNFDTGLTWDFVFRFKRFSPGTWQTVRGGSHLKLNADGRIDYHRDYWDAAEELYEKLPAVGSFMRWLKRRANQ